MSAGTEAKSGASGAQGADSSEAADAGPPGAGGGQGGARAARTSPSGIRLWARDLRMGARFAVSGGRQGWTRTVLTAVGVALGVAVLLLAASIPGVIEHREARQQDRGYGWIMPSKVKTERGDSTVLVADAGTKYHDDRVFGRLLQAEGDHPVKPAGVDRIPAPGEMLVSPALRDLFDTPEGKGLRDRLDERIVGTIGDEGLEGPQELAFYLGSDGLSTGSGAERFDDFQVKGQSEPLGPILMLLIVVACAVLIMPVAVFIATATRFGGEQRDRRLAALRLVGADGAMARRMAAGESLVAAVLGLVLGTGVFLLLRQSASGISLFGMSVFPEDIAPSPLIGALIALGVPAAGVAVSLLAMRNLIIEPLGVVRQTQPRKRRLWWRLAPPVIGLLLLIPLGGSLAGDGAELNEVQVISGVVLLLSGVVLLLPWLVERIVGRLNGGSLAWQFAVRRLQLTSGTATRAVNGITIAVAGAIALQMLFSSVEADETQATGQNPDKAQILVTGESVDSVREGESFAKKLKQTPGVRQSTGYVESYESAKGGKEEATASVVVGTCPTLRELADVRDCREGGTYLVPSEEDEYTVNPKPGRTTLLLGDERKRHKAKPWTVPADTRKVTSKKLADGDRVSGVLATPSSIPFSHLNTRSFTAWVNLDPKDPEALENVRTTAFHHDPGYSVMEMHSEETSGIFEGIRRGILAAAVGVLVLIGSSMILSILEQLRERKRQLAVLVAFGTPRSLLAVSILWQTAIPVVLGIALAAVTGGGLGWALLRMTGQRATDWSAILPIAGVGLAVIAVVTLASLPALWRMMRPDGLRSE
ncbi:FtsX-like permease family protein [Streptomyces sp. NPDC048172]|uniref:FtsX-like permease family protein n=1 Tax=Streptomyces sp. NPDC048172 TaxID=3365505 RepID=UPI003721B1FB